MGQGEKPAEGADKAADKKPASSSWGLPSWGDSGKPAGGDADKPKASSTKKNILSRKKSSGSKPMSREGSLDKPEETGASDVSKLDSGAALENNAEVKIEQSEIDNTLETVTNKDCDNDKTVVDSTEKQKELSEKPTEEQNKSSIIEEQVK